MQPNSQPPPRTPSGAMSQYPPGMPSYPKAPPFPMGGNMPYPYSTPVYGQPGIQPSPYMTPRPTSFQGGPPTPFRPGYGQSMPGYRPAPSYQSTPYQAPPFQGPPAMMQPPSMMMQTSPSAMMSGPNTMMQGPSPMMQGPSPAMMSGRSSFSPQSIMPPSRPLPTVAPQTPGGIPPSPQGGQFQPQYGGPMMRPSPIQIRHPMDWGGAGGTGGGLRKGTASEAMQLISHLRSRPTFDNEVTDPKHRLNHLREYHNRLNCNLDKKALSRFIAASLRRQFLTDGEDALLSRWLRQPKQPPSSIGTSADCLSALAVRVQASRHAELFRKKAAGVDFNEELPWLTLAPFTSDIEQFFTFSPEMQNVPCTLQSLLQSGGDNENGSDLILHTAEPFQKDDALTHSRRILQKAATEFDGPFGLLAPRHRIFTGNLVDLVAIASLILKDYSIRLVTAASKLAVGQEITVMHIREAASRIRKERS